MRRRFARDTALKAIESRTIRPKTHTLARLVADIGSASPEPRHEPRHTFAIPSVLVSKSLQEFTLLQHRHQIKARKGENHQHVNAHMVNEERPSQGSYEYRYISGMPDPPIDALAQHPPLLISGGELWYTY